MGQHATSPMAAAEAIGRDGGPFRVKLRLASRNVLALCRLHLLPFRWRIAPGRAGSLLPALVRAGRFYLLSLVYGAAVYGFLVAYLLMLGAIFEPVPPS